MRKFFADSAYTGRLPEGCKLCAKGKKMVVFITGLCNDRCFYCPLSEKRKNIDESWVNERPVREPDDIIVEARITSSSGAGITGGNPLVRIERVVEFIRLLKTAFGTRYHLHLYTSGKGVNKDILGKLYNTGLDEIRFHFGRHVIRDALDYSWDVGAEIPVLPDQEEGLKSYIGFLSERNVKFLNLNELEFSDTNSGNLKKRGYELSGDGVSAKGSRELAISLIRWYEDEIDSGLSIHFCSAKFKDSVQLRNRFILTAKNIAQPYEKITEDGLLRKGIIFSADISIMKDFPKKMYRVNTEKGRIETSETIARILSERGYEAGIVEQYPTWDRYEAYFEPL